MNEDIVPGLLAAIENDFKKSFQSDGTLKTLYAKIESGKATQADGEKFAHELGRLTAEVFHRNVTPENLPNQRMYYNIANRIIPPTLQQNYGIVNEVMRQVIEHQNQEAGIGIKYQEPEFDEFKAHELAWVASQEEDYSKIRNTVETGLDTNTRMVADECVRKNAEFQYDSGLSPKIVRESDGKCCEWCANMAGTYEYKSAPKEVYGRHAHCGCTVEFVPGNGKRQNVHTKDWTSETESAMMRVIKTTDNERSPEKNEARKKYSIRNGGDRYSLERYKDAKPREISKEMLRVIRQYAEEKGVLIQSIKEFDGDVKLLKSCIDTIAKWQEFMPCAEKPRLSIKYMPDNIDGATNGREIVINAYALRDRKITEGVMQKEAFFAYRTVEGIFVHEYGHAFENSYGIGRETRVEFVNQAIAQITGDKLTEFGTKVFMTENISQYSTMTNDESDSFMLDFSQVPLGTEYGSEIFAKHETEPTEFTELFLKLMAERAGIWR